MHNNTILIICGPTAVGKTSLALKIAQELQTEIISADSRQCFTELTIGVAKPSSADLAAVNHYFINSHSICDEVNAGTFEKYALEAAQSVFKKRNVAVIVGGTGLYLKAFCEGMDEMPSTDPTIRQKVISAYNEKGLKYLQKEVAEKDPAFWAVAEQQNPQRLMRALEVFLTTGTSVTNFRKSEPRQRPFNIIKIGLELPRDELYNHVNSRVDTMMNDGLLQEVSNLYEFRNLNALQTVGYEELFKFLEEKISLQEAVEKIKINTRHYAKRQMTWFKKDPQVKWFHPHKVSLDEIFSGTNF